MLLFCDSEQNRAKQDSYIISPTLPEGCSFFKVTGHSTEDQHVHGVAAPSNTTGDEIKERLTHGIGHQDDLT